MIFSNWEFFRSIGKFFSQLGRNLVPETGPSFVTETKPWHMQKSGFLMMGLTLEES